MSDNNRLSEKQRIEKAIGQMFLDLYNRRFDSNYVIVELSDTPDVICKDNNTGNQLLLEVTLLEDLPGDVAYALGRAHKPISPTTSTTAVSFFDDSFEQLRSSLSKKLLSYYGENTALVMKQVSPLWEPKEWETIAERFRKTVLNGKERNFGAGVWIICTDNSTWPAGDTLFCLSNPSNSTFIQSD